MDPFGTHRNLEILGHKFALCLFISEDKSYRTTVAGEEHSVLLACSPVQLPLARVRWAGTRQH